MNLNLPVCRKHTEIVEAVRSCDTVIITAETGSGKSTQVPQMLYEAGYEVIVTEPRRVAAVTLANRVAHEMNDSSVVGYKTAFESTQTADTKILFCTDGLKVAQGLKSYHNQVLVIDEVHEWNLNVETLIAWIKNFRQHGNHIKVVIMSATIDSDGLSQFFGDTKTIHCDGTLYNVEMCQETTREPEYLAYCLASEGKNVLMFQPGKAEIDQSIRIIKSLTESDITILPLHSELSMEDQRKVFNSYPNGKIIVSTNIAQTSLTIPDIDTVIDTGLEKIVAVQDGIEGLILNPISQADCRQRAGRAGRTKNGVYYLCSSTPFEARPAYAVPEIQRLILDKVVLKLISVHINPHEVEFYHPVDQASIEASIKTLQSLDALTSEEELTDIGAKLVRYPVGVKFGRMLIAAEERNCMDEMILAVSIFETGSLLSHKSTSEYYRNFPQYWDYLDDFSRVSDLISEMMLYNQIAVGKYQGKREPGLNFKNYRAVRMLSDKLSFAIQSRHLSIGDLNEDKQEAIRQCIIRGLRTELYCPGWSQYVGLDGNSASVDRQSFGSSYRLLVGVPRTIHSTSRYGDDSFTVVSFCTKVHEEDIPELYPSIQIKADYDDISYSSWDDTIMVPVEYVLNGNTIYRSSQIVTKEDQLFSQLYEKIVARVQKQEQDAYYGSYHYSEPKTKYWARDDGKLFEIKGWSREYIEVPFEELDSMPSSEIKYNGSTLRIRCEECMAATAALVKQQVIASATDRLANSLEYSRQKTFKISKIKEMLKEVGIKCLRNDEYNVSVIVYLGLTDEGTGISFKAFSSQEEYTAAMHDALAAVLNSHIKTTYPDKKFFVRDVNGKKITTKKSEAAKEDFKSFCAEMISGVTADSFEETLTFIKEMFDDYQRALGNMEDSENPERTSMFS